MTTYLITGSSGQLGQLAVEHLARRVEKSNIIAMVRSDEAAKDYEEKGITTRRGDYNNLASLMTAFKGVDRLLLISSSEIGQRIEQHCNVITAAKESNVGFIAYTSILYGPDNPMRLASEHIATEKLLANSGLTYTLLRNGWYLENYLMGLPQALESGQQFGASGDGRLSPATRSDYAEAAAVVLSGGYDGEVLELAGDQAFTMTEFVSAVSDITGKPLSFVNIPEQALKEGMVSSGLPEPAAAIFADADSCSAKGALFNDSYTLSKVIGHPTRSYIEVLKETSSA